MGNWGARLVFDEEGVRHDRTDGVTETLRWDDLREVRILTTDQGPYLDDVIWVLTGTAGSCAIPSETDGMGELLTRLQQLPAFDNEAVIKAMASTDNASFVCWRRGETQA